MKYSTQKNEQKTGFRAALIASVAALSLGAPVAYAQAADQQADPMVQSETEMNNPVDMPQVEDETIGEKVEQGAQNVEEGAEDFAQDAGEAADMAKDAAKDTYEKAENAVSDPDVWNPNEVESASETELAEAGTTMYIIPEAANVRTDTGTSSDIAKVLKKGDSVTIYENKGNWTRISAEGESPMWIYSPLLTAEGTMDTQTDTKVSDTVPAEDSNDDMMSDDTMDQPMDEMINR